jgi:hypothetical protein
MAIMASPPLTPVPQQDSTPVPFEALKMRTILTCVQSKKYPKKKIIGGEGKRGTVQYSSV